MLEVKNLQVAYGAAPALWAVSLNVKAGELLCVVGPNGAGKTTFINTIAGIQRSNGGSIHITDSITNTATNTTTNTSTKRDLTHTPAHKFCEAGIAIVPEGRRLFTSMTVMENLELGSYLPAAKAQRANTLEQVLAIFPAVKEKLTSLAGNLSGGQQQMVAIARALMAKPKLLLLDEPSLGLSPLIVKDMFAAIKKINADGMTILLVEQNVAMAMSVSHRAYVLELGKVVAEGTPAELMARPEIQKAYLGL
jgi:branched-chain amino acid transport system ATP-binding protein